LLEAYDHQEPTARTDPATVVAPSPRSWIGLRVIRCSDRAEHLLEVTTQLRMVARDFLAPDTREQLYWASIRIADLGETTTVFGHARETDGSGRRSAAHLRRLTGASASRGEVAAVLRRDVEAGGERGRRDLDVAVSQPACAAVWSRSARIASRASSGDPAAHDLLDQLAIVYEVMSTAGIAELKSRLSAYLARVRAGEEVVVTDRGRPIARLVPVRAPGSEMESELRDLARAGVVRIGSGAIPPEFWSRERPGDPDNSVRAALLDERRSGR
jgi:prevent-host-death family protein